MSSTSTTSSSTMPSTMPVSPRVFAVIAGGGTAGHIIPGLAIAEQLIEQGRAPLSIAFVASQRPSDQRLLADSQHPRLLLNVDGLQRSISPRALWRTATALVKLVIASAQAGRQFRQWQPRVVVSVGGFASEPAVRAARALGIPVVVVSYDQHPGLATRRQARRAAAVAVAFADSKLPGATHTGAPVRAAVRRLSRSTASHGGARRQAAEMFGIDAARRVVVVMGGSLGSLVVNRAIEEWTVANANRADVAIVHLAGERYMDTTFALPSGSLLQYVRRAGHDNMADVWQLADITVCRAGASTVAELVSVGSAAIIIPWAQAADDHQRLNAAWLGDAGAALMVQEHELAHRFAGELSRLVDDVALSERLAAASYALGALNRSSAIGAIIESVAR